MLHLWPRTHSPKRGLRVEVSEMWKRAELRWGYALDIGYLVESVLQSIDLIMLHTARSRALV